MKICICDSVEWRKLEKQEILDAYFTEKDTVCEFLLFENAEQLILSESIAYADIFVVDICLGGTDGLSVVRELKERFRNKICILTSDTYDYLDEAMDLGVIRYILNGAEKERYYSALDKAVDDMNTQRVCVKKRNGDMYYLHKSEIVFVEAKGRKTFVLSTLGLIETNMNIAAMKELLNTPNFIKPHYSYIVNSDYISHIEGRDVLVKVNYHYFRVPIASKRVTATKKQLANV